MAPNSNRSKCKNDPIVIRGVHDVATQIHLPKLESLEGKLDALVNLVTRLAANRSLPLFQKSAASILLMTTILLRIEADDHLSLSLQESAASVLPMTTLLVSVLLHNNLEWMSILRHMLQTRIADHHSNKDRALDRKDGSQFLAFSPRNDVNVIRGVHDVATDTSAETRKLDDKIDALMNILTQPSHASRSMPLVARVCGVHFSNDHLSSFSARNDAIVIKGVHDVATDTSAETRKLEGKIDALGNLVTQLAANQKPA
ncbi:hypothetical protein Fmac_028579 [Flemingia macrophylla]|uniref:Uncharacterized protein n=1 Tax=Flemingia macrophylla TaxID=520843 RepID=A0ABD1L9B9_9FABA